ncbi:alpha-hydroxy-acid oxidizing protein [Actinoplanes sp. NBC_00393]|uniref:alpha-hydroxy acid oxidase n=1 Tax=Actinoplanes sp. NBC_00393 TaxID=2975953 RepID=UPI002E1EC5AF
MALAPVQTARQLPRWSELRDVVQFKKPWLSRLERANSVRDLRDLARRTTPRAVFDYVDGAAEEEITAARNVAAYRRVTFLSETLRSVADPDPSVPLLGRRIAMPLMFAPTGYTRMMHHHGEAAVAEVAQHVGVPYALSTVGSTSIEDVRAASPDGDLWFQLYLTPDPKVNEDLLSRAEAAGYTTILLTVDTTVSGMRLRDVVNGLTIPPTLTARTVLNMSRFPRWWFNKLTTGGMTFASLAGVPGKPSPAEVASMMFDPGLDLQALDRLRVRWRGNLVVKGVTTPASAREALERGADGVVVSNHGGRQLDRSPATLDVLPAIRAELGPAATVLIDGGVLHGQDILAARALGADAVMIGRAYLYGLMAGGRDGVLRTVELLAGEYQRSMQLLGVRRSEDLSGRHVAFHPSLSDLGSHDGQYPLSGGFLPDQVPARTRGAGDAGAAGELP